MKLKNQILFAILSGILVSISFPTLLFGVHLPEMGPVAFVALVPLFFAIKNAGPRRAFVLTFISALVWYAISIYWVYSAMHNFGHLPAITSVLVTILLVVIVAAYIAIAPMVAVFVKAKWRGELIVLLPVMWTAVELLRDHIPFGGFPWANIAMSQWRILPVIQIADITGVSGVIFFIVWFNTFVMEAISKVRGEKIEFFKLKIAVTVALVAIVFAYGFVRIGQVEESLTTQSVLNVGMVQANIPQDEKWAATKAGENLNMHRDGTKKLLESPVELIIWPESAFPWPMKIDTEKVKPSVLGITDNEITKLPFTLLGAITERPDGNYMNSAVAFDASGDVTGMYHKAHLVPFGEYVPYKKLFFFAKKLVAPVGNFVAGDSYEPMSIAGTKAGILICYEDVFPEISRKSTLAGAEFLANLTNDAWYGVSSAPFQHLAISVFRAVENRRFLLRATNSGVSAVIMPTGEINVESKIFTAALMVSPIALSKTLSPYTKLGDWFGWGCVAYGLMGLLFVIARSRRSSPI